MGRDGERGERERERERGKERERERLMVGGCRVEGYVIQK